MEARCATAAVGRSRALAMLRTRAIRAWVPQPQCSSRHRSPQRYAGSRDRARTRAHALLVTSEGSLAPYCVPPPRVNLVRYHGALAPGARLRPGIVAQAVADAAQAGSPLAGRPTGAAPPRPSRGGGRAPSTPADPDRERRSARPARGTSVGDAICSGSSSSSGCSPSTSSAPAAADPCAPSRS
jgi:hypothetical protein